MKRAQTKTIKPLGPTQERVRRGIEVGMEFVEAQTDIPGVQRVEARKYSVLDRHKARGEITERQHQAGYRLAQDWETAGLEPSVIGPYNDMISRGTLIAISNWSDVQNAAAIRYQRAIRLVGIALSPVVCRLCIENEPVGPTGLAAARMGLDVLADAYGF